MSDLTPPPDEPMPEQTRARIRADLLAGAQGRRGSRSRRWLVPAAAAAAVLAVAGLTGWAVQSGGDEGSEGSPAVVAPTGSTEPSPSTPPTEEEAPTPTAPPASERAGGGDCRRELRNSLPGAEEVAAVGGWISFWVDGDRYSVCAQAPGRTTVHRPLPITPVREDASTYAVSTTYLEQDGELRQLRVAGGLLPEGVTGITYRFPGGDSVQADTVEDDQGRTWWFVGVDVPAPSGNETKGPPIQVVVSLSGVQETYRLDWMEDTCAQVNHGC
jgi:hypothetical protein